MQEERDSTQQCLGICASVVTHMNQVHPDATNNTSTPLADDRQPAVTFGGLLSARQTTAETLKALKERLATTTTQLEKHLRDINNRLGNRPSHPLNQSNEQVAEQATMREEMESIKQCLAICSQAIMKADNERTNDFEDISMTDDGQQVVVSTIGDLISAKRVTAGARSFQWLGQMSDESLQQLSRDRRRLVTENETQPKSRTDSPFEGRWGAGVQLRSANQNDMGAIDK